MKAVDGSHRTVLRRHAEWGSVLVKRPGHTSVADFRDTQRCSAPLGSRLGQGHRGASEMSYRCLANQMPAATPERAARSGIALPFSARLDSQSSHVEWPPGGVLGGRLAWRRPRRSARRSPPTRACSPWWRIALAFRRRPSQPQTDRAVSYERRLRKMAVTLTAAFG